MNCLKCGNHASNQNPRYFVIPIPIVVPNEYYLCPEHENLTLDFDSIYNRDGTRKCVTQTILDNLEHVDFKNVREMIFEEE